MKLRDKVNQLTQQKLDAQKDDQERLAFVAKKESLVDDIQKFIAEVEESRDKIEPLEKEIISLRSQKADVIEEKDGKIAAILIELEKVKVTLSEVANINDELERFSRTAGERDLLCVSDELKKVKSQLKATEESIQMFNEQIRNIQQDLDSQQTRQRNILDNIRAR